MLSKVQQPEQTSRRLLRTSFSGRRRGLRFVTRTQHQYIPDEELAEPSSSSSKTAEESVAAAAAGAERGRKRPCAFAGCHGQSITGSERPFVLVAWRQARRGGLRIVPHLVCEHNAGG